MAEPTVRPECIGILGFLFGHRYPHRWDFVNMHWETTPFCVRCGLAAETKPSDPVG